MRGEEEREGEALAVQHVGAYLKDKPMRNGELRSLEELQGS